MEKPSITLEPAPEKYTELAHELAHKQRCIVTPAILQRHIMRQKIYAPHHSTEDTYFENPPSLALREVVMAYGPEATKEEIKHSSPTEAVMNFLDRITVFSDAIWHGDSKAIRSSRSYLREAMIEAVGSTDEADKVIDNLARHFKIAASIYRNSQVNLNAGNAASR